MWIVGKKDRLVAAAKELSEAVGQPAILGQAEKLSGGYDGTKKEVVWMAGNELRRVTLVALPEEASRYVTPCRSDVISKQLHGAVAGQDVVLAVGKEDALAAGLAAAKCLPPYSAQDKERTTSSCQVSFHGCSPSAQKLERLQQMAEATRVSQGLVDMPPNMVHPMSFKEFALDALKDVKGLKVDVIEGKELADKGYGLLYGVGQGSTDDKRPCLLVVSHPGSGDGSKGVALVGKGITYDTGGASLKPRDGMCGMKRDMGGSAGVFGAFLAAVKAGGLPSGQPLHLVLCLAENAIGSKMFLHDDIVMGYSGLTTEINNTDAEGRLVLSDGVSHVAKNLDCELIVDMATLTGAQGIATGSHHASILATDADLEQEVVSAGLASGDLCHPGIFAPELLLHEFNSKFADMKNSVKNRSNAQSSCAGLFIYKHLKKAGYEGKWLHIDMAYPVHAPLGDYATGYGVGLLCKYLGIV
jgi:probable aminopeptidase NPEPL1